MFTKNLAVMLLSYSIFPNVAISTAVNQDNVLSLEDGDAVESIDAYCSSRLQKKRDYCLESIVGFLEGRSKSQPLTSEQLRLLSRGLRKLAEWTDNINQKRDIRTREKDVYDTLLDRNDDDSESRFFLAMAHEDEQSQIRILREVLERDPSYLAARRVLASNLVNLGDEDSVREGLDHLSEGYAHAVGTWKLAMARETYDSLVVNGYSEEAESFKQRVRIDFNVEERTREAEQILRSGVPFSEKGSALRQFVDDFCKPVFVNFDVSTCFQGVELGTQLAETKPQDPGILRVLIHGFEAIKAASHEGEPHDVKLRELYRSLTHVDSLSADELFRYSKVVTDDEQLGMLESLVQDHEAVSAQVRASLAEALVKAGRNEEALREYRIAFGVATGRYRLQYGYRLLEVLRAQGAGYEPEAIEIEKVLREES